MGNKKLSNFPLIFFHTCPGYIVDRNFDGFPEVCLTTVVASSAIVCSHV